MSFILVAESGSTKTDWALINTQTAEIKTINTIGYNPYFIDEIGIKNSLTEHLLPNIDNSIISQIHFYGAGCSSDSKQQIVKQALNSVFTTVQNIQVNHDLLASARALLGHNKGFAAILGTGANTCIYDGNDCVHNIDSLGYLLGDEGSGSYIGRKLLRDFMRKQMPEVLPESFKNQFNLGANDVIIKTLYDNETPNRFLASFCKFTEQHTQNKYIQQIINESFEDFFKNLVSKYPNYQNYTFNCVGSVGYSFKDNLSKIAEKYGMEVGKIIQSPMKDLAAFHLSMVAH